MGAPEAVSAVVLAHARPEATLQTVARLEALEAVTEILVVDTGGGSIAALVDARGGKARGIVTGDIAVGGRNVGAREARNELLLMLDDDSWPLADTVERLLEALRSDPRIGVVGGNVRNVDPSGAILTDTKPGSFDWWLRAGAKGPAPVGGFPAFFFPEGGSLVVRDAFLQAGGFYEPYFFALSELDLATRLVACGWEVRYVPDALFDHLRAGPEALVTSATSLHYRIRNQLWYFWLRFPPGVAARRMAAYGMFDLLEATGRGSPGAWLSAVKAAWRERESVRADRAPLPRSVLRRAELNRGRRHLAWLAHQLRMRLPRLRRADRAG
jgi:GT2 family glycosyltransferase